MYIVVEDFKDLKDHDHIYRKNDIYPREGKNIKEIPKKRIEELSSKKNKRKKVLIRYVEEKNK